MTTSDLIYPVIVVRKQNTIEVAVDEDTLTTSTARDLKIGWFNGSLVADSGCTAAKVTKATFVSGKGSFWGYTLLLDRIIRVELSLVENPSPVSLDDLKRRILKRMKIDGRAMPDEQHWREQIRRASDAANVHELADVLLPYYDPRTLFQKLKRT